MNFDRIRFSDGRLDEFLFNLNFDWLLVIVDVLITVTTVSLSAQSGSHRFMCEILNQASLPPNYGTRQNHLIIESYFHESLICVLEYIFLYLDVV